MVLIASLQYIRHYKMPTKAERCGRMSRVATTRVAPGFGSSDGTDSPGSRRLEASPVLPALRATRMAHRFVGAQMSHIPPG